MKSDTSFVKPNFCVNITNLFMKYHLQRNYFQRKITMI